MGSASGAAVDRTLKQGAIRGGTGTTIASSSAMTHPCAKTIPQACIAALLLLAPTLAQAQSTTTTTTSTTVERGRVHEAEYAPNGTLLASGVIVLGGSYAASVIVAGTSDHDGDHHLYVPIAGPWLDLTNRGSCPVGSTACDNETTYKVLLVIDGVLQAAGALQIVGALLSPEPQDVTTERTAHAQSAFLIAPTRMGMGAGYGVAALARF
jgi:hypothetical protein